VVMILLFWAGSFFKDDAPSKNTNSVCAENSARIEFNKKVNIAVVLITALLLVSGPLTARWLNAPVTGAMDIQLPNSDKGWSGPSNTNSQWKANFDGATLELNGEYINGSNRIQLYIAYYAVQEQGTEIVNSENSYYDKIRWRRTAGGVIDY